ncbi:MAG: hypothetical protein EXS03_03270 [Phycisphaerales bacterium]|nr:hypothetical protein [Phycisphaerales bacterium]
MSRARSTIIVGLILGIALGCESSVDRGQAKKPDPPPAPQSQAKFDTIPDGGSKSTLGKARDAAVRTRDKIEARDAEIGKMADDIFKK